jgi:cobaltochelatase CobS
VVAEPISIDDFRARINDSAVPCAECGFRAHALVQHIKTRHNMSAGQYKQKHPMAKLASPIVSELIRRMDRSAKTTDRLETFVEAFSPGTSLEQNLREMAKKWGPLDPTLIPLIPQAIANFHFPERETKAVTAGLQLGKNVYVEGPTGCGKTELIYQIHAQMGRPMVRANMNGDVTVANFIGKEKATPQKGTYYMYGLMPLAMQHGYTLLIDEVDYTPPQIATVMNPVLEGKRTLYLPDTDETIVAQQGFNVIATGNTGGKGDPNGVYSGTEILNTAFLDRFPVKIKTDYLPEQLEINMLTARFPATTLSKVRLMVKAASEVRNAFKQSNLSLTLSTRKLIDYFELVPLLGEAGALQSVLLDWLDTDEKELVTNLLTRVGLTVPTA